MQIFVQWAIFPFLKRERAPDYFYKANLLTFFYDVLQSIFKDSPETYPEIDGAKQGNNFFFSGLHGTVF